MTVTAEQPTRTPVRRRRALGAGAAVLANVLLLLIAWAFDVDLTVVSPGQPAFTIGLIPIVIFTLGSALLGWAGLALLEKITRRATAIWITLAVIITLLSMFPVVGVEATGGAKAVLALMHLAVAVALIALYPKRAGD